MLIQKKRISSIWVMGHIEALISTEFRFNGAPNLSLWVIIDHYLVSPSAWRPYVANCCKLAKRTLSYYNTNIKVTANILVVYSIKYAHNFVVLWFVAAVLWISNWFIWYICPYSSGLRPSVGQPHHSISANVATLTDMGNIERYRTITKIQQSATHVHICLDEPCVY